MSHVDLQEDVIPNDRCSDIESQIYKAASNDRFLKYLLLSSEREEHLQYMEKTWFLIHVSARKPL